VPATPILKLCDDLVAHLIAAWNPVAPDAVERRYVARFGDKSSGQDKLSGRRVVICPGDYDSEPASRGEDTFTHTVVVFVGERYGDEPDAAGDVPVAWVDERVDFVHEFVVQGFDFGRLSPAWNPKLTTLSAAVTTVADPQKLTTANGLFLAAVEIVFNEVRDA
jgi:hypothetical protein